MTTGVIPHLVDPPAPEIERIFRADYGRAVQDAYATALQRWPDAGLPASPAGWIITTARNRAIDRLRREASREDRQAQAALLHSQNESSQAAQPGPYQVQAAINAVNCDAPTAAATDWPQVLQLYDQLMSLAPSPMVALNRAVALAEVEGPAPAPW